MLDGYIQKDRKLSLMEAKTQEVLAVVTNGEAAAIVSAPRTRSQLFPKSAALINVDDHNFLDAVRALVEKVNSYPTIRNVSVRDFIAQALEKEFGTSVAIHGAVIDQYDVKEDVKDSLEQLQASDILNACNGASVKVFGDPSESAVALVSVDDHGLLQSIRKVFEEKGRLGGDNPELREQMALILLREFAGVTKNVHINRHLVDGFGVRLEFPFNEDTDQYLLSFRS